MAAITTILAGIYDTAWGIIGVVGGVGSVIAMMWVGARSLQERDAEDDARAFYDEHGHWPGQEPGAAPDPLPRDRPPQTRRRPEGGDHGHRHDHE